MPQAFTIDSAMPSVPIPAHKTRPIVVMRSIKAPTLDGELATDEWPESINVWTGNHHDSRIVVPR